MAGQRSDRGFAAMPLPPLACDCHMHVFGDPRRYPAASAHSYAPRPAPLDGWRRTVGTLGVARLVVVQPSAYGSDNRCLLDTLAQLGGTARGIVQIDEATTPAALDAMHAAGVRGVRLNPRAIGLRDPAAIATLLAGTAARIARLGWHIELHVELATAAQLAGSLARCPVPVALDHLAGARAHDHGDALDAIVGLLEAGHCWIKASGVYRVSGGDEDFRDATPVAARLIAANPANIVWGSDWPHTAVHGGRTVIDPPAIAFRSLDEATLVERLADAAADRATFDRILVANPARLYDF